MSVSGDQRSTWLKTSRHISFPPDAMTLHVQRVRKFLETFVRLAHGRYILLSLAKT
jgi:hypothetical protein